MRWFGGRVLPASSAAALCRKGSSKSWWLISPDCFPRALKSLNMDNTNPNGVTEPCWLCGLAGLWGKKIPCAP